MKSRDVIYTSVFSRRLAEFIRTHRLNQEDFDVFQREVAENPEMGDIIQGTGGLRKIRLKAAAKGKSGGFRVCYYFHDIGIGRIYLVTIYSKNEKEDLTPAEKKEFKELISIIKGR
jgi:hypothetical protein